MMETFRNQLFGQSMVEYSIYIAFILISIVRQGILLITNKAKGTKVKFQYKSFLSSLGEDKETKTS